MGSRPKALPTTLHAVADVIIATAAILIAGLVLFPVYLATELLAALVKPSNY